MEKHELTVGTLKRWRDDLMGEAIIRETFPVSGTNHGFEEAVQRAVDARIAEFAASLEKAIRQHGSMLADLLKQELRNWASSTCCSTYCARCGNYYAPHSESGGCCDVCRHSENVEALANPTSLTGDDFKKEALPRSSCCDAETFVEDRKRRVCCNCGCSRPL